MKYTKNEIGELQDLPSSGVLCDCINVTKFIETNFSPDFYCKIICNHVMQPMDLVLFKPAIQQRIKPLHQISRSSFKTVIQAFIIFVEMLT